MEKLEHTDEQLAFVDMGIATLAAGIVTVNHPRVRAETVILLCCQTPGGAAGALRVGTRTPGTSFQIASSSGTDTSTVAWIMLERGVLS